MDADLPETPESDGPLTPSSQADDRFDTDALRRLFHSPFFHHRDGLDDYDDDYRQSGIGEAAAETLRRLSRKREQDARNRRREGSKARPEEGRVVEAGEPPASRSRRRAKPSPPAEDVADRTLGPFLHRPDLCAVGRGKVEGCRRCLEVCPAEAVSLGAGGLGIDPRRCRACGLCVAVCPTGALHAPRDPSTGLLEEAWRRRPEDPNRSPAVLLVLSPGTMMKDAAVSPAADTVPVGIDEPGFLRAETLPALLAMGYAAVRIRLPDGYPEEHLSRIIRQVDLADRIARGVRFPSGTICLVPGKAATAPRAPRPAGRRILPADPPDGGGGPRTLLRWAISGLTDPAAADADPAPLPHGAPFGAVSVAADACTLCLACVGLCPTGALSGGGGIPRLAFTEANCVQCGRCASGCPEGAVTLLPRIDAHGHLERGSRVVAEETPFSCIRCGAPFATRTMIETITARLAGNPMFAAEAEKRRLRMCADCRVRDRFERSPDNNTET